MQIDEFSYEMKDKMKRINIDINYNVFIIL